MTFEYFTQPGTLNTEIRIIVTDKDRIDAYGAMDKMDRHCISEWSRPDSSLEEKFMALQLFARKLEKVAA